MVDNITTAKFSEKFKRKKLNGAPWPLSPIIWLFQKICLNFWDTGTYINHSTYLSRGPMRMLEVMITYALQGVEPGLLE